MFRAFAASLSLFLLIGCGRPEPLPTPTPSTQQGRVTELAAPQPEAATTPGHDAVVGDRTLLFFLNPKGRPCQIQQAILTQLGEDLPVAVKEVSVLDDANRPSLYQYGIRSLPALLLVDAASREIHRFKPGIQQAGAILSALE